MIDIIPFEKQRDQLITNFNIHSKHHFKPNGLSRPSATLARLPQEPIIEELKALAESLGLALGQEHVLRRLRRGLRRFVSFVWGPRPPSVTGVLLFLGECIVVFTGISMVFDFAVSVFFHMNPNSRKREENTFTMSTNISHLLLDGVPLLLARKTNTSATSTNVPCEHQPYSPSRLAP